MDNSLKNSTICSENAAETNNLPQYSRLSPLLK